jgi:hypothetical protein
MVMTRVIPAEMTKPILAKKTRVIQVEMNK